LLLFPQFQPLNGSLKGPFFYGGVFGPPGFLAAGPGSGRGLGGLQTMRNRFSAKIPKLFGRNLLVCLGLFLVLLIFMLWSDPQFFNMFTAAFSAFIDEPSVSAAAVFQYLTGLEIISNILKFCLGAFVLLFLFTFIAREKSKIPLFTGKKILPIEEYIALLYHYVKNHGSLLRKNLTATIKHSKKFITKKQVITSNLLMHFEPDELSFQKFSTAIENINHLLAHNLNSLVIRLNSFNEDDYFEVVKQTPSQDKYYQQRLKINEEYINFVTESVDFTDSILLKMDSLQLETSKLKSLNADDIENLDVIQDINRLIEETKFYKE
jgi:hypothetical protein